jgi:hypothetical protein
MLLISSASADETPDLCSPNFLNDIGCIEVLVLRCAGTRNAQTVSVMNVDGTSDFPKQSFGLDEQSQVSDRMSMYDDRGPFLGGHSNTYKPPQPVPSHRSPYIETIHSDNSTPRSRYNTRSARNNLSFDPSRHQRPQTRYSEPMSPGARPKTSIPSDRFHYGSGPIPTGPILGSERSFYRTRPTSTVIANAPGVDPAWLNEILTKAVKRGVEESRRDEASPELHTQHAVNIEEANQPPGAWPKSPFSSIAPPVQHEDWSQHNQFDLRGDSGTIWDNSQASWGNDNVQDRGKIRVNHHDEPTWDVSSEDDSWETPDETQSDTWHTDDTWGTKKPEAQKSSQRSGSRNRTIRSRSHIRAVPPIRARTHRSHSIINDWSHRTRSNSQLRNRRWDKGPRSSSENRGGWTGVKVPVDSFANRDESNDTVHPSQSRSRKYSGVTPTAMDVLAVMYSSTYSPRAPPPASGQAFIAPETLCKHSFGTNNVLPAPFPVIENNLKRNDESRSVSSSWGDVKRHGYKEFQRETSSYPMSWDKDNKTDKTKDLWENDKDDSSDWSAGGNAEWGITDNGYKSGNAWEGTKGESNDWNARKDGWKIVETPKNKTQGAKKLNNSNANNGSRSNLKDENVLWVAQDNAWKNNDKNDKSNEVQWNNDIWTTHAPVATDLKPSKPASTSKRYTNKSLSNYRQLRSTSSDVVPKSHWQFPPSLPSTHEHHSILEHATFPAEPLLKISSAQASEKGLEHQVRAGKGTQYGHAINRPEYLDTFDKPYAVFRFKYRSRSILKSLFGDDQVPDHGHLTTHTPSSKIAREKEKLEGVSKEELIEKMIRLQTKLAGKEGKRGDIMNVRLNRADSKSTERVARDLTENWVKLHSGGASEKGKGREKTRGLGKEKKKDGADQGWDDTHGKSDDGWW